MSSRLAGRLLPRLRRAGVELFAQPLDHAAQGALNSLGREPHARQSCDLLGGESLHVIEPEDGAVALGAGSCGGAQNPVEFGEENRLLCALLASPGNRVVGIEYKCYYFATSLLGGSATEIVVGDRGCDGAQKSVEGVPRRGV